MSVAIRDISDRKRLEAAVRRGSERLTSAVEAMQDGFALFDDDGRLILCHSVFRRLLGDTLPGAFVGRSYDDLFVAWVQNADFPNEAAAARFRSERLSQRETHTTSAVRTRDGRSLRIVDRRTSGRNTQHSGHRPDGGSIGSRP